MARPALTVLGDSSLCATPPWLPANTHYLCMMGSIAYGASGDSSDVDVYGWAMPPLRYIFPHTDGHIHGFGDAPEGFEQYQQHHIKDGDQEYDFAIYNVVKYFTLVMNNNPNMVDSLFVPQRCVLHSTRIANRVRDARRMFLHKGSYHKFKGYAYAQMHKLGGKANAANPKRAADIAKYGWDTKFGYHVARLADECEQILTTGDLDITRGREMFKSIRRGEWTLDRLREWFQVKEKALEEAYAQSTLPMKPPVDQIKQLLMDVLEEHYGSLSHLVKTDKQGTLLAELREMVARYDK